MCLETWPAPREGARVPVMLKVAPWAAGPLSHPLLLLGSHFVVMASSFPVGGAFLRALVLATLTMVFGYVWAPTTNKAAAKELNVETDKKAAV